MQTNAVWYNNCELIVKICMNKIEIQKLNKSEIYTFNIL